MESSPATKSESSPAQQIQPTRLQGVPHQTPQLTPSSLLVRVLLRDWIGKPLCSSSYTPHYNVTLETFHSCLSSQGSSAKALFRTKLARAKLSCVLKRWFLVCGACGWNHTWRRCCSPRVQVLVSFSTTQFERRVYYTYISIVFVCGRANVD